MNLALVFLGGGIGAVARYVLQGLVYRFLPASFPYGTVAVNIVGSFLIGFLMSAFEDRFLVSPELRIFLTVGVLGGFTTFSSFSYETLMILREGSYILSLINIAANVILCLIAAWLGSALGKLV
ncbi:MAG TPA: fluoride efflux transporter CrcB [Bacteroidota bacterium]|nr:fluoride efflux transporter CrcB [Bacteroidota bacterium]